MSDTKEQKAEPREPVAQRKWIDANDGSNCGWWEYEDVDADEPLHEGYQPLYAAPPRQELSEEDVARWLDDHDLQEEADRVRAIEQKVRG